MKLKSLFNQKVPLIVFVFIWYYRIFGITFGGLVTKKGESIVNKKLKVLGNILTISLIILYLIASRFVFSTGVFDQIYDSGFIIIYYTMTACKEIKDILVVINLYYYQFKGFNLFEILMKYKLTKIRYNLFLLLTFILHVAIQGICAFIYLTSFKMNVSFVNVLFLVILNIIAITSAFAIHFITWGKNFSIYCYKIQSKKRKTYLNRFLKILIIIKFFFNYEPSLYQWLSIWKN
jgi:hypothetical protein